MERKYTDAVFVGMFIIFIWGVLVLWNPGATSTGLAIHTNSYEEVTVPNVELLSPRNDAVLYGEDRTFLFELHNTIEPSRCSLIIDGVVVDSKETNSDDRMNFMTPVQVGYHKWKVECSLINSRTISSMTYNLRVKNRNELRDDYIDDSLDKLEARTNSNFVTGNAVYSSGSDRSTVVMLLLLLIGLAALVFVFHKHKHKFL